MNNISIAVGQNLELDMPGSGKILYQIDRTIAKGTGGFARGRQAGLANLRMRLHNAHSLSSASSRCLNQDGVSQAVSLAGDGLQTTLGESCRE